MRVLHHIRNNPVVSTCVVLVALNAWVAVELVKDNRSTVYLPAVVGGADVASAQVEGVAVLDEPVVRSTPVISTALPKLKPGMTRAAVEELLGTPPADQIHAVTANENRITYRTTYELTESEVPMTIRPIQSRARIPARPNDPLSFVALEFDASLPGHPLLGVLYPDPLF